MQEAIGDLSERIIHLVLHAGLFVARKAPVAHMANDSDDLKGRAPEGWTPDLPAGNVCAAEGMPGEVFIDYDHRLAAFTVMLIEEAAGHERDAHEFDIAGRYGGGEGGGLAVRGQGSGSGAIRNHVFAFPHGNDIRESGRFDAGEALRAIEYLTPGLADLRRIIENGRGERKTGGEYVMGVEAGLQRRQGHQGAAEHPGGNQQDECERDFRNHKRAMQVAEVCGNAAAARTQRLFQPVHGDAPCRRQSEEEAATEGNGEAEEEHAGIDVNLSGARQTAWPERNERMQAGECEENAEEAAAKP